MCTLSLCNSTQTGQIDPGAGWSAPDSAPTGNKVSDGTPNTTEWTRNARATSVKAFIVKRREEYVVTLPLRFTGVAGDTISGVIANFFGILSAILFSEVLIRADFSVQVYFTTRPNPLPTAQFRADLARLPLSYSDDEEGYQNLIKKYGTHVIDNVTYGARLLTTSAISKCENAIPALNNASDRLLLFGSGIERDASFIESAVGGRSVQDLKAFGIQWWLQNLNRQNSVPIDVGMRPINDPAFVDVAAKRVAIDDAIEDMTPWQLPTIPELACETTALAIGVIIAIAVGIALVIVGIVVVVIWFVVIRPKQEEEKDKKGFFGGKIQWSSGGGVSVS